MKDIFGDELRNAALVVNNPHMSQIQKGEQLVRLFSKNLYRISIGKIKSQNKSLFVLPFAFMNDDINKTSHYIVFITKNYKALYEMKRIMLSNSNSNNTTFSFDEKDEYSFSLFDRKDNIYKEIKNLLVEMLNNNRQLLSKETNIIGWAELIDRYSMKKYGVTTNYTISEIKEIIQILDTEGYINIISEIKRKRITDKTLFSFDSSLLGE